MADIHPLSIERHGKKQFILHNSWSFVGKQNLSPILCTEFSQVAFEYPIVFSNETENSDQLCPVALLGLQPDTNLFVDPSGRWLGKYIPATFRGYPFKAVRISEEKEEFAFCIDESGGHLVDKGGVPLYQNGKKSQFLTDTFKFVREYQLQVPAVKKFCNLLLSLDLFSMIRIELKDAQSDKVFTVSGLQRIDERKLAELSNEKFQQLRENGMLPLIYAHLLSLGHLKRLVELQEKTVSTVGIDDEKLPDSFTF